MVVKMLQKAEASYPYLDYISEQSVGTAAKITPLQRDVGLKLGLAAQKGGSQQKGATVDITLVDVGASRLVKAILTDYGAEYSVSFGDELSVDLTALSPDLPWITERLVGILGNNARSMTKEYFFDSSTDQLKRIELTLSSEGNPSVFTDVDKKEVTAKITLDGPSLTASLVEQVGEAQAVSDIKALLMAVSKAQYEATVADGPSVTIVPELGVPGTDIKIGMGLEVEKVRSLVRQRGVFVDGTPYVTETYNADTLVSRPGKSWWDLSTNALGGLWLIVKDSFNWISQQVSSGINWVISIPAKAADGIIRGSAQIIAPSGIQLYLADTGLQMDGIQEPTYVTVTAIGWVADDAIETNASTLRPELAAASGEGFVIGGIYDFQPYNLSLSQDATLVITYTDEALGTVDESCISMFRWYPDGNHWQPIAAIPDLDTNTFTASITQLGTFTLGCDSTPPQIDILGPSIGSAITNDLPLISAHVTDSGVGVDPATVEMRLDGQVVAAAYIASTGELVYLPSAPISPGYHVIGVLARDVTGNQSQLSVSFSIIVTSGEPNFTDVPDNYWARDFIERLYNARITGGCSSSPLSYCPENTVTRDQMAVFLERGIHGSSYTPPAVGATTGFNDVATNYWAAAWIKQLAADGITGGCGGGNYCPGLPVTRAQMAVFLLRAKYGSSYVPPLVGLSTGFTDVPTNYWAAAWIKQLASEGITGGCGTGIYCPETPVTRAQMAVFLVRAFNLP
jgi:hypothetical protein